MKYQTTEFKEQNLRKLAAYLLALPEGYGGFDMRCYLGFDNRLEEIFEPSKGLHECGSVGCAVGHGPFAGILMTERELACDAWMTYCGRVFIDEEHSYAEWGWCFGYKWVDVDNTPQGAAKRILWLLEHGLPANWRLQRSGEEELCYV